ncbi:hypothetical protein ABZ079_14210 [Streptomyces sp. NPDC006314]|uniref:hypothetical protein n=1 Tax=Streptomyces sp. NPDC006314 TaxID=3154475 RepID=UPI0033B10292
MIELANKESDAEHDVVHGLDPATGEEGAAAPSRLTPDPNRPTWHAPGWAPAW